MMVQVMETTLSSTGAEGQPLLCNGVAGAPGSSWPPEQGGGDCASPLHDGYRKALNRRDKNGDLLGSDAVISIELAAPERSEPRIVQEKFKTLVAFSFLSGNLILNLTCLAMVHERIPDRTKYPPLPDVFFDLFPPLDWALDVSEVIIIVCIWSTLLLLLIHRYRWIILQRVFLIMGLLYFMRSITMFVTQVPVASTTYYCSPKANTTNPLLILKRVAQLLSGFGLSINGQHTFCGDYIYSGHTVILTLAYLVVREYSPQRCKVVHITYLTLSCVGILMVLLSRGHYTVDVVIGYYVTTRLFWVYHTLANNQSLKVGPPPPAKQFNQHLLGRTARCTMSPTGRHCVDSLDASAVLASDWGLCSRQSNARPSQMPTKRSRPSCAPYRYEHDFSGCDDGAALSIWIVYGHPTCINLPLQPENDDVRFSASLLQNPSQNNYLARAWWFFIFSYFEKNVGAVVPRQYEWPLPWPRRWLPRTRIS
ncbi:unnamed protein product [Ixodes persulcatus]